MKRWNQMSELNAIIPTEQMLMNTIFQLDSAKSSTVWNGYSIVVKNWSHVYITSFTPNRLTHHQSTCTIIYFFVLYLWNLKCIPLIIGVKGRRIISSKVAFDEYLIMETNLQLYIQCEATEKIKFLLLPAAWKKKNINYH